MFALRRAVAVAAAAVAAAAAGLKPAAADAVLPDVHQPDAPPKCSAPCRREEPAVLLEDFLAAETRVRPSAMREVAVEVPKVRGRVGRVKGRQQGSGEGEGDAYAALRNALGGSGGAYDKLKRRGRALGGVKWSK